MKTWTEPKDYNCRIELGKMCTCESDAHPRAGRQSMIWSQDMTEFSTITSWRPYICQMLLFQIPGAEIQEMWLLTSTSTNMGSVRGCFLVPCLLFPAAAHISVLILPILVQQAKVRWSIKESGPYSEGSEEWLHNFTERMKGQICIFKIQDYAAQLLLGWEWTGKKWELKAESPVKRRERIWTTSPGGAWNWLNLNVDITQWDLHFIGQEWTQKFLEDTT